MDSNNHFQTQPLPDALFHSQQAHQPLSFSQPTLNTNTSKRTLLTPCVVCRSTKWHRTPSGHMLCEFGHQSTEYREEQAENDEQWMRGGTRRIRTGAKRIKTLGTGIEVANNAPLDGVLAEGATGEVEKFLIANGIQSLLKCQIRFFRQKYAILDDSFDNTVKTIWFHYISIIGLKYSDVGTNLDEEIHPLRPWFYSKDQISPKITLVILQLALRHHGLPILLNDIFHMVVTNELPFMKFEFPSSILRRLPTTQKRTLNTRFWRFTLSRLHDDQYRMLIHLSESGFAPDYKRWAGKVLVRLLCSLALPISWHGPIMRLFTGVTFPDSLGMSKTPRHDYYLRYIPIEYSLATCLIFYTRLVLRFNTLDNDPKMTALISFWKQKADYLDPAIFGECIDLKHFERFVEHLEKCVHMPKSGVTADLVKYFDEISNRTKDKIDTSNDFEPTITEMPWLMNIPSFPLKLNSYNYLKFPKHDLPVAYSILLTTVARLVGSGPDGLDFLVRTYFEHDNIDATIDRIIYRIQD